MKNTSIVIGAKVVVRIGDKEREFQIVSSGDANVLSGCISIDSPIAKSILGKEVGYVGRVLLPNNVDVEICVLNIK